MSNSNRARTRAIRQRMAETGESYIQAANALGASRSKQPAPNRTDLVRDYVRTVLEQNAGENRQFEAVAKRLESEGHQLVDGGQTGPTSWEISDYRTGGLLAQGDDGLEGYDKAALRLDPEGKWFHVDEITNNIVHTTAETHRDARLEDSGLSAGLADVLEDWALNPRTPEQEVAEFVEWTVETVAALRQSD